MSYEKIHEETARNLVDEEVVGTFISLASDLRDSLKDPEVFSPIQAEDIVSNEEGDIVLDIDQFEVPCIYSGPPREEQIRAKLPRGFQGELGELRTITRAALTVDTFLYGSLRVSFCRSASGVALSFCSSRIWEARQAVSKSKQEKSDADRALKQQQGAAVHRQGRQNPQALQEAQATENRCKIAANKLVKATDDLNTARKRIVPYVRALISLMHSRGLIISDPPGGDALGDGNSNSGLIEALREQVATFRDTINTQARNNEQLRQRLLEQHREGIKRLEEDYAERHKNFKEERAEWVSTIQKRVEEDNRRLEDLRRDLESRERSLDLQNERETRRNLRENLQNEVAKRAKQPDLSSQAKENFEKVTRVCKWTISITTVLLLLVSFVPAILEVTMLLTYSAQTVALMWSIRVLAGILLVVVLIYYIRELSSWSKQVNVIELRSKQFALDINRASWLVEMNLEYEKEGKVLPEKLIDSFAHGLFESNRSASNQEHPSSSLLHLLRNAESLNVKTAGGELSISGKQIRKADIEAAKDDDSGSGV
ncbi:MAG: hypothetical protein AAGF11_00225 [Myxococcota bacterium]